MITDELKHWRKAERARLIAARLALNADVLAEMREAIDAHLLGAFPDIARGIVAFCWPYRNEYDARHVAHRLRALGASTVLPVVVANGQPLIFRRWKPG